MFDFMLTEEQKDLREKVRIFVKNDVPQQLIVDMDQERVHYPREYIEKAAARNLLGLRFPKQYGGKGLKWEDEIIALEEIGVLGTSLGCLYSLVSIIGEAINSFGTEEQKEKFLKPTVEGRLTCAEGLTEPRGGSDFFGTTTIARKEGDYYVINGQKRFVVGAEGADYFMIYCKTDPNAEPYKSISAFLVERGPGVEVEYVYGLMGTRGGGAGRVVFNNCKVPAANLLGEENGAARIFYRMMLPERMTSAAAAIGTARAALNIATDYSTKRRAFGNKIKNYQGVSFKLADSTTKLDASRALVYAAARAIDADSSGGKCRRMVSEAKKFSTDAAWEIINDAMQIMGGIGYTSVYPIERLLRDSRLLSIWTGTNEIMNLIIQHEMFKEHEAAKDTNIRDTELDAVEAMRKEEKVYE